MKTDLLPSLFQTLKLPYAPTPGLLTAETPVPLPTQDALIAHLQTLPGSGWICQANALRCSISPSLFDPSLGILLSAEFSNASESFHLRLTGDSWLSTRILRSPSLDASSWIVPHSFLPSLSRFCGFKK